MAEHPAVGKVAVIGVPHATWGEASKAFVVLRAGQSVSAAELLAFVAERKGSYKTPKALEFVETLPETVVHKLDKRALRELARRTCG